MVSIAHSRLDSLSRCVPCPPEKVERLMIALRYFELILRDRTFAC